MPSQIPGLSPSQLNYAGSEQWKKVIEQAALVIRCSTPAFLLSAIDPTTQTVTVQIAIQEHTLSNNGSLSQWQDIDPINRVPVILPRGGGFAFTLPLKRGDTGMLIFCDTCFDNWYTNGQNNAPVAANRTTPSGSQIQFEERRHDVSDCGFYPGMGNLTNLLANYDLDNLQIRTEDGTSLYEVSDEQLTLASPLTEVTGNLKVDSGASGTFTTSTGQTVTVQDGVIIDIS